MNERGYHHITIGGLILVLLAIFLFSPYVIEKVKGLSRKEDAVMLNLEAPHYPNTGYSDKVSPDVKALLILVSDAESRLNRLQIDSIMHTWYSLDTKSRDAAVDSLVKDMTAHKKEWSTFWDTVNSSRWGSLTNEAKIAKINGILTSLLEEQAKIVQFNKRSDCGKRLE